MSSSAGSAFVGVLLALLAWDWISHVINRHVLDEGIQHVGWWKFGAFVAVAFMATIAADIKNRWAEEEKPVSKD